MTSNLMWHAGKLFYFFAIISFNVNAVAIKSGGYKKAVAKLTHSDIPRHAPVFETKGS